MVALSHEGKRQQIEYPPQGWMVLIPNMHQIEKPFWANPRYNAPHPTPLFLSKGQGFEIGN
jgi:hypothetical protein